jgi:hypothetical protein
MKMRFLSRTVMMTTTKNIWRDQEVSIHPNLELIDCQLFPNINIKDTPKKKIGLPPPQLLLLRMSLLPSFILALLLVVIQWKVTMIATPTVVHLIRPNTIELALLSGHHQISVPKVYAW